MRSHYLILTIFSTLLISCGGESSENDLEEDTSDNLTDSVVINFETPIRPESKSWVVDRTYFDTLIFKSWDDNYDYWYAFFEAQNGESVSLVSDEAIEDRLGGSVMLVEWKIDSLYEAGEGDELYYKECLISYSILEEGNSFEGFLQDFIKAYSRESDDLITDYMDEVAGFVSTMHPGLYCVASGEGPTVEPFISWDCVIEEGFPEGDFCEGYPGTEDGLYYQSITEDQLPAFDDMTGEGIPGGDQVYIPGGFEGSDIMKVLVVVDEYHFRYLYFLDGDSGWFFWIEDICDCSA